MVRIALLPQFVLHFACADPRTQLTAYSYDSDNTVFSPQGRLHQVEYALEAVKQGSAAVGLRSKTHVVLLALKRSTGELASYQKKLIRIDDHIAVAIAGLTSDARVLSNFMRQQAMSSRMLYARPIPVSRVVSAIADKAQINTQHYGRRPYGVGFLVAGHDSTGPHLYEFAPSGNCFEYYAMAIGARSQSAKTYLERHFEEFENASLEELINHGLLALRESLQQDKELTIANTSVGIVGPTPAAEKSAPPPPVFVSAPGPAAGDDSITTKTTRQVGSLHARANFHTIEGDDLKAYIDKLPPKEASRSARAPPAADGAAPQPEAGQAGTGGAAQPSAAGAGGADDSMQTD